MKYEVNDLQGQPYQREMWEYEEIDDVYIPKKVEFEVFDLGESRLIENRVSSYLNNLTISVIPSLHDKTKRMQLENKLIATLNIKNWNFISKNWLGNNHPNSIIVNSGLWNIQGLNGNQYLTKKDLEFINDKTRYCSRR